MRKVKRPRKSPNPSKHYFNERLHNITSANLTMPSTMDDPVQAAQQEIIMDLEEMEESDDYLALISNLPVVKPASPQASSSGLQEACFSGTQEASGSNTQHASGSDMQKSQSSVHEDLANIHEGQSNMQDGQGNVHECKASMPEDQGIPEGKGSMLEGQGIPEGQASVQETYASIQEGQSNTQEVNANIQEATASMQDGQASIQADQSIMPSQPGPSSSNSMVDYCCEKVLEESSQAVYDRNAMAYAIDAELERCIEEVAMAQREAAARNIRMANEQKD